MKLDTIREENNVAINASKTSLDRMTKEIITATKRYENIENKLKIKDELLKKQGIELLELKNMHSNTIRKNTTNNDEITSLKEKINALNKEMHSMKEQSSILNTTNTKLNDEMNSINTKLTKEREESSLQFSVLSEECKKAVQGRNEANERIAHLQKTNDKINNEFKAFQMNVKKDHLLLIEKEKELNIAIAKLSKAFEACEGEITCMHCLRIFVKPSTLITTGETYCTECIETNEIENVNKNDEQFHVKRLETLSGKFDFMKVALTQLKNKM